MHGILWLSLGAIILLFCWAVYAGYRSWRNIGPKKRIAGLLLLAPHLLLIVCLIVCVVLSLMCGVAAQGSRCFNEQFVFGVLVVFILPVPALVGTALALILFRTK
jgi:hypothetical protein